LICIAAAMTAGGYAAPRVNSKRYPGWGATSIRYILKNERYAGTWRYGARRWVKNPQTKRRHPRPQTEDRQVVVSRPDLAVVDAETFERAQARFRRFRGGRPEGATRRDLAPNPLTGLCRCGVCGSPT
jgi:hypothetical protein